MISAASGARKSPLERREISGPSPTAQLRLTGKPGTLCMNDPDAHSEAAP